MSESNISEDALFLLGQLFTTSSVSRHKKIAKASEPVIRELDAAGIIEWRAEADRRVSAKGDAWELTSAFLSGLDDHELDLERERLEEELEERAERARVEACASLGRMMVTQWKGTP